ncbi:MAG: glycoside hydrolase family 97 N-terminal domain-containing protein, partial [Bacteroidaceae bacterium]|nr:glycoside hydrolase family 97 N-terminal domain-containing protein [Bacteroidaceae bacterium]
MPTLTIGAEDFTVASPDGHLKAVVTLSDEGKLSYTVSRDERTIVSESPLGLTISAADFREGLELLEAVNDSVDDAYTLPVGKRSQYRDHCNTLSVTTKKGTWKMTVLFRLYDDGFAFRYVLPKYGAHSKAILTEEASRIRVAN